MTRQRFNIRKICLTLVMSVVLLFIVFGSLVTSQIAASFLATSQAALPPYHPPTHYGTFYLYIGNSPGLWDEDYRTDMRAVLQQAQALSLTTIVQGFPNILADDNRENDWLIFLDEAESLEIKVVAHLILGGDNEEPCIYNSSTEQFDCSALKHFLDVVGHHPALIGYVGSHEPLQEFDSDQLRNLYTDMKTYAPNLLLANYMSDIYWFEQNSHLFPNRTFSDGICDICMIWYYPFRYIEGAPVFETTEVDNLLMNNIPLIKQRDPDAQIWFLGQTFAYDDHPRQLRMPTPVEMADLYPFVMQHPVDGFLWYAWRHGTYDLNLGDPSADEQQDILNDISDEFLLTTDLVLQQQFIALKDEILPDDVLTYTLTYTNNGPEKASGVSLQTHIPDLFYDAQALGTSGPTITRIAGTTYTWQIGHMEPRESGMVTLTIKITTNLEDRLTTTTVATISSSTIDTNLSNNWDATELVMGYYHVYLPILLKNS